MQTGRYFASSVMSVLCCHAVIASNSVISPMSESQIQGAIFIDSLSVPSPGEVFAAMNKVCRPNWATLVLPISAPVSTERSQLALAVGVLSANGYIAVEAQDGQQVKNVGREMMSVAKSLGISESLMGRGNSLIQFADNSDWEALAGELEATENEVKATMVGQKDKELVTLTSAAAWLRGLQVATTVILANPTLQGAEVIDQSSLARHLLLQLDALPTRIRKSERVVMVYDSLDQIATILEKSNKSPDHSLEKKRIEIQKIQQLAAGAVQAIMTSASAPASIPPIPMPQVPGVPQVQGASNISPAVITPSKP